MKAAALIFETSSKNIVNFKDGKDPEKQWLFVISFKQFFFYIILID